MSAEDRINLLREAEGYVTKDRNSSYGEPEDNFKDIASIWNAQLSHKLSAALDATDVALLMTGMKLARLKRNPNHRDSWADGVGYLACGWDTVSKTSNNDAKVVPFKRTPTLNNYGDDVRARDIVEAVHTQNHLQLNALLAIASDPVKAEAHKILSQGWLSQNRCGNANPHAGHSYSRKLDGTITHAYINDAKWCDGYVYQNEHKLRPETDAEAVVRVADRSAQRAKQHATEPGS